MSTYTYIHFALTDIEGSNRGEISYTRLDTQDFLSIDSILKAGNFRLYSRVRNIDSYMRTRWTTLRSDCVPGEIK